MDDMQLGRLAASCLENEAFRQTCEATRDNLRAAFMGGNDQEALDARNEVKALERVLTRLTRMRDKGAEKARQAKELQE